MRKLLLAVCFALGACNAAQVGTVQTDVAQVSAAVAQACNAVNAAAAVAAPFGAIPQVGAILTFATASCMGANAVNGMVAKAVNDPNTIAWLQRLAGDIKAAVPHV